MSSLDVVQRPTPTIIFPQPDIPMLTAPEPTEGTFSVVSWVYTSLQDPFSLSFAEYSRLTYREALELQNEVYRTKLNLINDAWRRGKRQIVICDEKIMYETESLEDIPNDKIIELAKEKGKACYVFSNSEDVEEFAWTPIDLEDDYPTIGVYCGAVDSKESDVVKDCPLITADFDTGNPGIKFFDANRLPEPIALFVPPLRHDIWLGRPYPYFDKTVKLCVKDTDSKTHSLVCDVRVIRDWAGSALLRASPNRVGLVGRDLMRRLGIRVELDPIRKTTRILDASS